MADPTVTMFAPGGTLAEIPVAQAQNAQAAGFKVAVSMTSPNGQSAYIPVDRQRDALSAGFKMRPMGSQTAPAPSYWEALTNPVGSGGRDQGLLGGALQVGGQAVKAMAQPIAHPIDTLSSIGNTVMHPINTAEGMVQNFKNDMQQGGLPLAAENAAGQLIGTVEGGRALGGAAKAAAPVVRSAAAATGEAAQDAGTGLMNKTVGTLKADFKRGANPARGYLKTGNGPALTMQGIADKAVEAKAAVGQTLGNIYDQATAAGVKIPVQTVAEQMAKPIQKAIDLETGPGGTGNLAPIRGYIDQFGPTFAKAEANGGFTPSEVFEMKKNIAENTNWSDPAQFSLKSVRQQQAGALSGILSDTLPDTADLNQHYQDLTKFVNRATERANTGSRPLTAHIYKAGMTGLGALAGSLDGHALAGAAIGTAMDSVPFKSALATGLYRGGRALSKLAAPADRAAMEDVAAQGLGNYGTAYKGQNPQLPPPAPDSIANLMQLLRQNRP